jgi:hypothetical protein
MASEVLRQKFEIVRTKLSSALLSRQTKYFVVSQLIPKTLKENIGASLTDFGITLMFPLMHWNVVGEFLLTFLNSKKLL